ncbi:MAG: glycosyltransferase family 4 protein [Phycisphaerae bacterium]|nr:glycosyltransferase family 4 protein [Phycisphaerae bacterium]
MSRASLLIALPHGLNVSGVTAWAVRLASGLASRGRAAGLILHPEPEGQRRVEVRLPEAVRVFGPEGFGPLDDAGAGAMTGSYARAIGAMPGTVVLSPNLVAGCYAVAAGVSGEARVVGWAHSDNEYDARVLEHYAPMLGAAVAVSERLERRLSAGPLAEVLSRVPYGVEVPAACPARGSGGPPRLLYGGRLEHRQKRVLALVRMSRLLTARGVGHTLTILGDGPARDEVAREIEGAPDCRLLGAVGPEGVRAALAAHDALVLASRYEGLSVAMLEAMAAGCVPIVTRTESGALEAIADRESGVVADVSPDADEDEAARALAEAVAWWAGRASAEREAMARRAHAVARERYSIERHLDAVERIIDAVAAGPARPWPRERPTGFVEGGSIPADGAARMSAVLASLAGRRVVIHGCGAHTRGLWSAIERGPAVVVGVVDDDRQRQGTTMRGLPVVGPEGVWALGATDVVISSWMHEGAIWARRRVYESRGLRVHRLYGVDHAAARAGREARAAATISSGPPASRPSMSSPA